MRVDIILATNVFFNKKILSLVVEDYVDFLGAWAANVGSCETNLRLFTEIRNEKSNDLMN